MSAAHSWTFAAAAALFLLAAPAAGGRIGARGGQGSGSKWFAPPHASVYSEPKRAMPQHTTQAVELLRFVTAYKRGVEALVDVTPYSALLRSAADTDQELTFFAFIDTWVGNNTPEVKPVMAIDGDGSCTESTRTQDAWGDGGRQGNGWQIDVDLVFWPPTAVDTRPRESVTISSGVYGGYSIGSITYHEGKVAAGDGAVEIEGGVDLTGTLDAEVYACPGGVKDAERGVKMAEIAKRVRAIGNDTFQLASIVDDVYNQLAGDSMATVTVTGSSPERREVEATFNAEEIRAAPGMPVFYEKDDIQQYGGADFTFPRGQAVGKVVNVAGDKLTVRISGPCFPGNSTHLLPRLRIEKFPGALPAARKLAESMGTLSKRVTNLPQEEDEDPDDIMALLASRTERAHGKPSMQQDADASMFKPFLVTQNSNGEYSPASIIARVDLGELRKEGAECAPSTFALMQVEEQEVPRAQPLHGILFPQGISKASAASAAQRLEAKAKVGALKGGEQLLREGDKVCVLARRATGRVFERSFDLPSFHPAAAAAGATVAQAASAGGAGGAGTGDRVLLQFAVTGHGWSGSTEQCGEFCHAIYHISVNGEQAFNVTEWRDDCERNPINNQLGTWTIPRDGWCPGSVEPGLYIDMTEWLKQGRNEIAVDLSVWSSTARQYKRYTNYGGYEGGNGATLFVGATAFVYDGAAVDAVRSQDKAYTAAEAALRDGCSLPKALQPPGIVNSRFGDSFLQLGELASEKAAAAVQPTAGVRAHAHAGSSMRPAVQHTSSLSQQSGSRPTDARYDFEAKAPWYLFDKRRDGALAGRWGATVVPAFVDGLIQINSREIRVKVNKNSLPKEWGQAAVHLRLERPGKRGRSMDNWDRVGSFGMAFEENAATTKDPNSKVTLRPSAGRKLVTNWKLAKVSKL